MPSVSDIIDIAKISQYLINLDILKGGLYANGIDLNLPNKIYSVRKNVEWLYELDNTDSSLTETSNYLYALCAPYSFKAQIILNGGSGTTPIIPVNPPSGYSWTRITTQVNGDNGSPIAGEYTFYHPDLVNALYVTKINVNNNEENILDGNFSFNSTTGVITRTNQWFDNDVLIMDFVKVI